jgi:hypothetical protein
MEENYEPTENLEPTEPTSESPGDFMPPTHPPKTGCLAKLLLLLILGVVVGGGVAFFGNEEMKDRIKNLLHPTAEPTPMEPAPAEPISTPTPELPILTLAKKYVSSPMLERKQMLGEFAVLEDPNLDALGFLKEALPAAAPDLKLDIVAAYGQMARKNPAAIPPLVEALDDKALRAEAIPWLGSLGPTAAEAIPKLKKIAMNKKEKKATKMAAQKALTQIQGKAKPAGAAKHPRKKGKKKKTH